MKKAILFLILAINFSLSHILSANADYISPGEVDIKTAAYRPQDTDFDLGVYKYNVSWQGIPVAEAKVSVGEGSHSLLKVNASAETGDVISLFYKMKFNSESTFKSKSLEPIHFKSLQKENSREKMREVSFASNGVIKTKYIKNGKQQAPTEFRSNNSTFDPISAAFLARSLPVEVGVTRSFDVFNGKHRYLIKFLVEALETIDFNGEQVKAFRVKPSVKKLTDTDGETRLKYARIWISADENRNVLKLESKVLVGKVSAILSSFKGVPSTPQPILITDNSLDQYVSVGISEKK